MVNYAKSKIYKIEPIVDHDEGDIYIGSTTKNYLSDRMSNHRGHYKLWKDGKHNKISVYDIFEKYGIANCNIYLIENFPCESKNELAAREGFYIKANKCVNRCIAGRTKKEYREDHKDEKKEYDIQYWKDNEDKLKEKHICDCGKSYTHKHKIRHMKSKKHQNYLNNL